jgi:ligand-binding sensor protein
MDQPTGAMFDVTVWQAALDKYGAVVRMSVWVFDADERLVCGPLPLTPIVALFEKHGHEPDACARCVHECLAQPAGNRPPVIVDTSSGLAVVGVSLVFDGRVVGVLVAGYAMVAFCESVGIARLARETRTPFQELWTAQACPDRGATARQDGEVPQVPRHGAPGEFREADVGRDRGAMAAAAMAGKDSEEAVAELHPATDSRLGQHPETARRSQVVHGVEVIERNAIFQLRGGGSAR